MNFIGRCSLKFPLVVVLPLLVCAAMSAQAPDTLWTRTYDGLGVDEGYSIRQMADGGFIIVGNTGSSSDVRDVYLLKTDSLGDTLWTKRYGGNEDDRGWEVMCTSDGGFMIAGYTKSFGAGNHDFYLIRSDSLGDTLWTRTYGGTDEDVCLAACYTYDQGCIMAGRTLSFGAGQYDFYVVKTDSLGDTLWTKTYGGAYRDVCAAVQQTSDSGYILVGGAETRGPNDYDVYLLRTSACGDTLWTLQYGIEGVNRHDAGYSVQQTFDEGYIVTGFSYCADGSNNVCLLRTDANGDTLWTRHWGGSASEIGRSVIQTPDGTFAVASLDYRDYGVNSDSDIWLLKVDVTGDTVWTAHYGDTSYDEWPWSMLRTSDGGYAIVGRKAPYAWPVGDVYFVKTAPDTLGKLEQRDSSIEAGHITATIISGPLLLPEGKKCRVFDITGRVVVPDKMSPGIYFIEIEGQITKKVVKVR
jgi:hypothetical protein